MYALKCTHPSIHPSTGWVLVPSIISSKKPKTQNPNQKGKHQTKHQAPSTKAPGTQPPPTTIHPVMAMMKNSYQNATPFKKSQPNEPFAIPSEVSK